jgi:hypothetical protein
MQAERIFPAAVRIYRCARLNPKIRRAPFASTNSGPAGTLSAGLAILMVGVSTPPMCTNKNHKQLHDNTLKNLPGKFFKIDSSLC